MAYRDIGEYHAHVINVVVNSDLTNEWHKIKLVGKKGKKKNSKEGSCYTKDGIRLNDGAIIILRETIIIEDGRVNRKRYSYQYTKGDYFFRYDKEPDAARHPDHALCHLHANQEEPRYISHETSLEEFIEFVKASFYS